MVIVPNILFQSTLPRGERQATFGALAIPASISIHAPARGATGSWRNPYHPGQFQSTLPRGERPFRKPCRFTTITISIHAPARGATERADDHDLLPQFQSTLPRGERLCTYVIPMDSRNFNPRSREGSDQIRGARLIFSNISIHAPARGATSTITLVAADYMAFQSTLPRGERLCKKIYIFFKPVFQSTLPRGERRKNSTHL